MMPSCVKVVLVISLSTALVELSPAHHSPSQYDQSVTVEKQATVIRFEFRNPHSYILVSDSDNAEWWLETSSAVRLRRKGWNPELFAPGDRILFKAHANRDSRKNRLYLTSVTASDGVTYALQEDNDQPSDSQPVAVATSLEGTWRVDTGNFDELFDGFEKHPLTDKALAARAAFDETQDPVADCIAYPTPHLVLVSFIYPMRIELSDNEVVFHHEFYNTKRTVFLDGREHSPDNVPTNQGYSAGYWDDDTLVVDTRNFTEHLNPMLGDFPSSTAKHVIERYTLGADGSHATVSIFLDDPEYLAEPMNYELILRFAPDESIQNFECDPEIAKRYTE